MAQYIPKGITRTHLEEAIRLIDNNFPHLFADSIDYDIEHEGKRYPPKAVVGVAAELIDKRQFTPYDFKGGEGTLCFKLLRANGFRIIDKHGNDLVENTIRGKMPQIFGAISGVHEGDWYPDKKALREAGIHRMERHGIDGSYLGASSIVLNAGYPDDYDNGDEILYTGHGGNDEQKRIQVADQSWTGIGNRALLISEQRKIPVRVTRGADHSRSIGKGYVYGGLYLVTAHKLEIGKDGFKICRFFLQKIGSTVNPIDGNIQLQRGNQNPDRRNITTSTIIRDLTLAEDIKKMYAYSCQICGTRIKAGGIPYAEAAHIKPLGRPHNGPDVSNNLLCLCPNHHALFDLGGFSIDEDFRLLGLPGILSLHKMHKIGLENLMYHKQHIFIEIS